MKLLVYGTDLCPDCVAAQEKLREASIEYEYRDFNADLRALMEFLAIRDDAGHNALFAPVREKGGIGIPCFLIPDVEVTLDIDRIIELAGL